MTLSHTWHHWRMTQSHALHFRCLTCQWIGISPQYVWPVLLLAELHISHKVDSEQTKQVWLQIKHPPRKWRKVDMTMFPTGGCGQWGVGSGHPTAALLSSFSSSFATMGPKPSSKEDRSPSINHLPRDCLLTMEILATTVLVAPLPPTGNPASKGSPYWSSVISLGWGRFVSKISLSPRLPNDWSSSSLSVCFCVSIH